VTRAILCALACLALLNAAPVQLDSQAVLQRYELAMSDVVTPKILIFAYSVSQFGPNNLEARHIIYRDGLRVRDETLSVDGVALKQRVVHITRRVDRYALARVAPRASTYTFLFVRAIRSGKRLDYEFDTAPILATQVGFSVTRVIVDGRLFLPRKIFFTTASPTATGKGELDFSSASGHWVPVAAIITASLAGRLARERITWGGYRFPPSLPPSTFSSAKPLPIATLPPI